MKNVSQIEFNLLYKRLAPSLFRYFSLRINNRQEAEDMVAEVFIRYLKKPTPSQLNTKFDLDKWLFGIARNLIKEKYRELAKENANFHNQVEVVDDTTQVDEQIIDEELKQSLLKELKALPFSQSEVIALKLWEDKTFVEVAQMTQLPVNTVKSNYYRGLESLRLKFQTHPLAVVLAAVTGAKFMPEFTLTSAASQAIFKSISNLIFTTTTMQTVATGASTIATTTLLPTKFIIGIIASVITIGTIVGGAGAYYIYQDKQQDETRKEADESADSKTTNSNKDTKAENISPSDIYDPYILTLGDQIKKLDLKSGTITKYTDVINQCQRSYTSNSYEFFCPGE